MMAAGLVTERTLLLWVRFLVWFFFVVDAFLKKFYSDVIYKEGADLQS